MYLLLLASLIWSVSYGLIKDRLAGLDPTAVAALRLAFACVTFLPFFRPRRLSLRAAGWLALIGAIQFGFMYALYLRAFAHLHAYEVVMFTIFTPLYVALFEAGIDNRFEARHAIAAVLAVAGAALLKWRAAASGNFMIGFLLMQASNLCFAAGQIAYRRIREHIPDSDEIPLFAWLYAGGLGATLLVSLFTTSWFSFRPDPSQWLVLSYLGIIASGVGFFLWNRGATRVNAGTLAAFNNAKIPVGVAVSLLFFGESADPLRLLGSFALIATGVFIAEFKPRASA